MFNAPRRMGGNLASSAFISSSSSANPSFDPLAASMPASGAAFGEVDPWSAVPSPARSGTPRRESDDIVPPVLGNGVERSTTGRDGLNALLDDPPMLYLSLLDSLEPQPSGTIPLSSVHRLLGTSRLPASTIEHILTLTARDASYLSRTEFFCALALVALAQSSHADEDISLERLSQQIPTLPLPNLSPASSSPRVPAPPAFTPGDTPGASPWDTAPRQNGSAPGYLDAGANGAPSGFSDIDQSGEGGQGNGSALVVEAERGYWKKLEKVEVSLVSQKEGWFLQKYTVTSDKRSDGPVSRRYSDFVWLLDCLIKRYPFRLLPSLPPKRIGADAVFLEQRRKGLQRFLNMLTNHPVTRDDGALNVFLTESSFESWRKRTKVSTDEESVSKRLNTAQEMGIPSDLEEKLGALRDNLPALLAGYQKLVLLAERSLARLQAASADASRIALSLGSVGEGVGRGLGEVGEAWTRAAELSEKRAMAVLLGSIEALKTQRDLYLAFRDLFVRHDRLSKDSVDALRKKVEGRVKKIEGAKSAQKAGWEVEVDKLVVANEQDNSAITSFLSRRVFIRACMWHELSVVFHSRQAAQVTLGWRDYAREEAEAAAGVTRVWEELGERLKAMPVE